MEQLLDYRIPVWHPILVHFPVVLSLLAAGAGVMWLAVGKATWRRTVTFFTLLLVPVIFITMRTGEALEEQAEGVPIVDQFVELHELAGKISFVLSIVSALILLATMFAWKRPKHPVWFRVVVCVVAIAVLLAVGLTAHIGGIMVWGEPVG